MSRQQSQFEKLQLFLVSTCVIQDRTRWMVVLMDVVSRVLYRTEAVDARKKQKVAEPDEPTVDENGRRLVTSFRICDETKNAIAQAIVT